MCSAAGTERFHGTAVVKCIHGRTYITSITTSSAYPAVVVVFSAAGCVPFSTSLISSYFSQSQRAAAIGFFYWGIFLGYSMSFVLIIAVDEIGWRPVYVITGVPGIVMGFVVLFTIRNPDVKVAADDDSEVRVGANRSENDTGVVCFAYCGVHDTRLYSLWILRA